ncbi:hypothetical protein [Hymenobacter terrenus]|uniref:hypothetical protein n=1 Tax=Hymenobacter terrenus TaxID=1629124 RepID=UPI0012E00BF3|nr:hypothetical protein [Hymenobacter terrenus]
MPASSQTVAVGAVLLLLLARTWYVAYYPLGTDEVASYDYFVAHGPIAISCFYPIPNNHIFYNFLAWPLAQVGLSPRLVMRLPTLVLGTIGTVAGYILLARLTGLRLATLVTGLVGMAPLWLYYAAVGRGYFVQFCLLQLGLFAVVELLRPASGYIRLSWLTFITSSILGLYTIPTYAYPLAGLVLGLGAGLLLQGCRHRMGELLLAGLIILVVTSLLYAPVVAVSGWRQLVSNRYVVAKTSAEFWNTYRAVLYERAAELFGPSPRYSGPAWLAGTLLGGLAVRRWVMTGTRQTLGLLTWTLLALPLLLMAAQRVYAPTRLLLYTTFLGYLLGALLVVRLPVRRILPVRTWWPLIVLAVIGIGGIRLYQQRLQIKASQHETLQFEQAYQWLETQATEKGPPAEVWLQAPLHELFFAHYLQLAKTRHLTLHAAPGAAPEAGFDFLVIGHQHPPSTQPPPAPYHPVYRDELVTIYAPKR